MTDNELAREAAFEVAESLGAALSSTLHSLRDTIFEINGTTCRPTRPEITRSVATRPLARASNGETKSPASPVRLRILLLLSRP
jgi:hypothetical protein